METTAHIDFIAAAYAAAVIVVGALIVWVMLDFWAQSRKLADLELQGITRRSDTVSDRPASRAAETAREQAEEQA
ncbi:MAG: heme exporter protein CcmD [Xanthobacteraceae bacterium]|jgi:heme exporter protein D